MLGSLARKLRAFGFDTTYYRAGDDRGLLAAAHEEGRVVLTSDRGIAAGSHRARVILVVGSSDSKRLSSLSEGAKSLGIGLFPGDSRCSLCNGALSRIERSKARGSVPDPVAARHRLFFRCESCGRFYWRGGHWKKLRSLRGRLKTD